MRDKLSSGLSLTLREHTNKQSNTVRTHMKRILLALLMTGLLAATAQADGLEKFKQADKDNDGKLTWEEFKAAYPKMERQAFDAIDLDKDTYISSEEWLQFLKSHQKNMGQGGMGGGMGGGMPPAGHPGDSKPMIMPPSNK